MPDLRIKLRHFFADEAGATAIEYAMIASMLSVAVVGSAFLVGGGLQDVWNYVQTGVMAAFGD